MNEALLEVGHRIEAHCALSKLTARGDLASSSGSLAFFTEKVSGC